ncbi:MAG: conjugal transfer protein TraF [Pseudomonadota bacterium]
MNPNNRHWLSAMAALAFTLAVPPTMSLAQDMDTRTTAARSAPGPGYWTDNWRGWHFYEEPEPNDEAEPPRKRPPSPMQAAPAQRRAPELVQFEALQKTLEQYRNIAIIKPTEANVRRYMELESKVVAQASYFADVAQRVAWATPELDPTLQGRPVNAKAIEVFEQDQLTTRSQAMATLGKDHVLFFFFRGDCPFCHAFAPTLEAFQARYGINVVAISVDGGPIPGFPNARNDNGIARTLKVTQVPALFLAQPYSGKISPIGFGVLSESQLLERISTVAAPATQEMAPGTNKHIVLR